MTGTGQDMEQEQGAGRRAAARIPRARRDLVLPRAKRDLILIAAILVVAMLLLLSRIEAFLLSLERMFGQASLSGGIAASDRLLMGGMMLNLALIMFGWRRYRDLVAASSERDAARAHASSLARTDHLTGLLNRRALVEDGNLILAHASRQGQVVALLAADLDRFKTVNEIHGHQTGDAVLRTATDIVRRALPASAIAARLDGDGFAILMPFDPRQVSAVDAIADHLVAALAHPIVARGMTTHIGASIGIARSEPDCQNVEALLRRAHIAMRAAKAAGRGRHAWFKATMESELLTRNAIEAGMREGIPAGQFVPYYEPQIDLASGRLIGFEMLARWEHPARGVLPPDSFIPIAEECGLIADLSVSVMRRAFVEARDWDPSLSLSVNISPTQLRDPWLAQKIVKLLVETGFPANRLEIEITESSLFQNLALAQSIVNSLKNQGIRIALDDFGTGYSSLSHLRALPFDRIKIDKSFITAMNRDPEAAAIVHAISGLGASLNLPITAEGVENADIYDSLRKMGCNKGQGWHFGKPMTIAATRRLLAEKGLLPSARAPLDKAAPDRAPDTDTDRPSAQRRA